MKKKIQTFIGGLSVFALAVFLGCASVQDAIIPCFVPKASSDYADAEPKGFLPYTTLFDAKRIDRKVDYVFLRKQAIDKLEWKFLKGLNQFHIGAAEEFAAVLFSPESPLALFAPALFAGVGGSLLIRRPGDKSKKEYETAGKMKPEDFVAT